MTTRRVFRFRKFVLAALTLVGCGDDTMFPPFVDPGEGEAPGEGAAGGAPAAEGAGGMPEMGGEPAPALCEPLAPVWRRPGGFWSVFAGYHPAWRQLPDPGPFVDDGTEVYVEEMDACGRVTRSEMYSGCWQSDGCEYHWGRGYQYDEGGRLTAQSSWSEAYPTRMQDSERITHVYEESGARVRTSASFSRDSDNFAGAASIVYVNDERGHLIEEIYEEAVDEWDLVGVPQRRSTFAWDDAAGTVTESVDDNADGAVDRTLVHPLPL